MRRLALASCLALTSCVSLEEAPVQRAAIQANQRTVLLAYGAPAPLVVEDDSKGEAAAKSIPGLALVVQSAQDDRDLANSKDLQSFLPRWDAAAAVLEAARPQLAKTPHKGKWVTPEEAGLSTTTLQGLNGAANVLEWRRSYYDLAVAPGRDYSKILELDDALVFELNVAAGVVQDGEGNAAPALWAVAKLFRAQSMRQLWRHEDTMQDTGAKRLLYDFKVKPDELVSRWKALAPKLAEKIAASYVAGLNPAPKPTTSSNGPPIGSVNPAPTGRPLSPAPGQSPTGFSPTPPGPAPPR